MSQKWETFVTVPILNDFSLSVPFGSCLDKDDIDRIQSSLARFAPTIRKLKLAGAWVDSSVVSNLPGMPLLQSVQLMPGPLLPGMRIQDNNSPVLLTKDVVNFAQRCPELMEPKFLRDPKLLSTVTPIWSGPLDGEYGGDHHPDWRLYCQNELIF